MAENDEGLFCAKGKSGSEIIKEEYLCETCEIGKKYNLTSNLDLMEKMILKLNLFYCENCSAK